MSKRDKLLKRLMTNAKDIRFDEIRKLLLYFGFTERQPRSGSSHYTYKYENYIITVPKHSPLNKVYVMKVLDILKDLNLIKRSEL